MDKQIIDIKKKEERNCLRFFDCHYQRRETNRTKRKIKKNTTTTNTVKDEKKKRCKALSRRTHIHTYELI